MATPRLRSRRHYWSRSRYRFCQSYGQGYDHDIGPGQGYGHGIGAAFFSPRLSANLTHWLRSAFSPPAMMTLYRIPSVLSVFCRVRFRPVRWCQSGVNGLTVAVTPPNGQKRRFVFMLSPHPTTFPDIIPRLKRREVVFNNAMRLRAVSFSVTDFIVGCNGF